MGKEHYDLAYELESKKFPAIIRMTNVNRFILIFLLALYIFGSFALAILLGDGDSALTLNLFIGIAANLCILMFGYKCVSGNVNPVFQAVAMVIIPLWSIAVFFIPEVKTIANMIFVGPLLWLEIMILVEKRIHKAAQRRANDIAEEERERINRQRADAFNNQWKDDPLMEGRTIRRQDARYCDKCGIELGPNDIKCPMCSKQ